jgi:hypothetical protein
MRKKPDHYLWADSLPLRVECLFCAWSASGVASWARTEALAHRREAHPETLRRRRHRPGAIPARISRPRLSAEERAEVDGERRKRMFLHGLLDEQGRMVDT